MSDQSLASLPRKKNSNAFDYAAMTDDQKKLWQDKMKASKAIKKEARLEKLDEQKKIIPELINLSAYVDQFDAEFKPREEILEVIREAIKDGVMVEEIRQQCIDHGLKTENWDKLTRFLFRNAIPHAEDLGLGILQVTQKASKRIERRIKDLENLQKSYPLKFHDMIFKYEKQLIDVQQQISNQLISLGLVGSQKTSPQITIVNNVPRPEKEIPTFKQFTNDDYTKLKDDVEEVRLVNGDQTTVDSNILAEALPSNQ